MNALVHEEKSWFSSITLLRALDLLHEFDGGSMPTYEHAAPFRWQTDRHPDIVLFISHRWRDLCNPDPDGATLRALRNLLLAIDSLARGIDPACNAEVPDLRLPYMLQASVIFSRLIEVRFDGEAALANIAIFYDYSCLPQGEGVRDRELLLKGLSCFPHFIPDSRVTLVAIRSDGDHYEKRAWCVAEAVLSVLFEQQRPWAELFPLRLDINPQPYEITYPILRDAIEFWVQDVSGRVSISGEQFLAWQRIIDYCVEWFTQEREGASKQIHHSGMASDISFRMFLETMIRLAEQGNGVTDIVPAIVAGAIEVGLECSKMDDLVPAGLLILSSLRWEQLNRGEDQSAPDVWQEAFERYCNGQPLKAEVRLRSAEETGKLKLPRIKLCN
ncbi:hypothetical protein [Thiothrix lacustris]|jgi:hypothetical protein|uniref:hypothetical protein n=1 Tax=Thiothrix lacustris TaxID=525917 RepID=UPI00048D3A6E|nr:hypothetical protein [Thiothrix lacustris]